jgi:hypothetical protein
MAKCMICGKSPLETALFRVNKTGVEGVFACKVHLPKTVKVDRVVKDILKAVDDSN